MYSVITYNSGLFASTYILNLQIWPIIRYCALQIVNSFLAYTIWKDLLEVRAAGLVLVQVFQVPASYVMQ